MGLLTSLLAIQRWSTIRPNRSSPMYWSPASPFFSPDAATTHYVAVNAYLFDALVLDEVVLKLPSQQQRPKRVFFHYPAAESQVNSAHFVRQFRKYTHDV